ncbi:MAG: sugar phosphate isomerase/epimerase family protein [Novosphingobium sp.]
MTRHPISLAAGIMPEATPAQLVEAAVAGGFDTGGMWVERESWSAATTRAVKAQLRDAQLKLLDVEVAWIMPGPPDRWLVELVDIAAELGAPNLLCVSSDPDPSATTAKLQAMVDRAAGTGVRINLEFGLFTAVRTIGDAASIVAALEGAAKGLLCDTLHWARSGGASDDIRALPREWLGYAQLCDAPAQPPDLSDMDAIIDDAINRRVALGAGGLPLAAMVDALPPGLPVAIEERSEVLRTAFPDLNQRAREVARTSRLWLDAR